MITVIVNQRSYIAQSIIDSSPCAAVAHIPEEFFIEFLKALHDLFTQSAFLSTSFINVWSTTLRLLFHFLLFYH